LVPEENSALKTVAAGMVRWCCLKKGGGQEGSIPNLSTWVAASCQKGDPWDKGLCRRHPVKEYCGVRQQAMPDLVCCSVLTQASGRTSPSWVVNLPEQLWCSGHLPGNGDPNISETTGLNQNTGKLPGSLASPYWLSEPSLTSFAKG